MLQQGYPPSCYLRKSQRQWLLHRRVPQLIHHEREHDFLRDGRSIPPDLGIRRTRVRWYARKRMLMI